MKANEKKLVFLLVILLLSFICNFYIEERLKLVFSGIKTENIKYLEHCSNKNFHHSGIENMGEDLQKELIKMNADRFDVKKDYFYFFQNKVICVSNQQRCLEVTVGYNFSESLFTIKGFQSCNE